MRLLLCCTVLHSTTRTWASCQGVIVLLSALPLACGKSEDLNCVIQRLDKQTRTLIDMLSLFVLSTRPHTALLISTSQAIPSSQRLSQFAVEIGGYCS